MAKIIDNEGQYKLTLPKDLVELLGWKKGDTIVGTTDQYQKNMILIKK